MNERHAIAALLALTLATGAGADDYIDRGKAALEAGDHETAVEIFEDAIEADADNAEYHYLYGASLAAGVDDASIFRKLGIARAMRGAWERAVALDPDHARARTSLFQFYLVAPGIAGGDRDKALAELDEIARIAAARPDDTDLWLSLGLLNQEVERWPTAAMAFEHVVATDPARLMAWYQIGRTALRSGVGVERGIEALEHYLTQTPGENDPPFAWAHTRLGQLYAAQGDADTARGHYEAALALEPEHEEANKALEAL